MAARDEKTNELLGFITLLSRASYPPGTVKVMAFAVAPAYQNRGIGKILMSTVFKIFPNLTRLFLCTRITNQTAIEAYKAWGFTPDAEPIMDHPFNLKHWIFLSYYPAATNTLQTAAMQLKT